MPLLIPLSDTVDSMKHKKIPSQWVTKAHMILTQYEMGELKARKSKRCGYLSLEVGRNYRLLNTGTGWELMTHETYNRKIDK